MFNIRYIFTLVIVIKGNLSDDIQENKYIVPNKRKYMDKVLNTDLSRGFHQLLITQ